jgi:CubicO group peptidase (beta-lactamase class C family)
MNVLRVALLVLLCASGTAVSTAADLLSDGAALEKKVTEIVHPFLQTTAAEKPDEVQKSDDAKAQAPPPTSRAWGIAVGVVSASGRHVFGYGQMSETAKERPDGRTLFEIGSITKTFTALLLANLNERGKLRLDDPVQKYLPDSVAVPKRREKEITLLHLATHTSALPRVPLALMLQGLDNPYRDFGTEHLYETLKITPLTRDPGERYSYSNLGYGLLGHVLSRQADCSYEELIIKQVCTPLGLSDTRIQLTEEQRERLAPGHTPAGKPTSNWDFDVFAGAGALRSTTDDMLRYVEANMGLMKTDLLPAMQLCHRARHKADNPIQSIGLGWHVQKMPGDARLVFHGGGTGGYNSIVGFVEDDGQPQFGLVVLANSGPEAASGMASNSIAIKLLEILHRKED